MLFGIFWAVYASGLGLSGSLSETRIPSTTYGTVTRVVMQKPGDPEKIIEAEYERLKSRGTREGLELFIVRHPDHPLAEKAREDIKRLHD